jgi:hypothetical protein
MWEQQQTDATGVHALGPSRSGAGGLATLPLTVTFAEARKYLNFLYMRFVHNSCKADAARIGMW